VLRTLDQRICNDYQKTLSLFHFLPETFSQCSATPRFEHPHDGSFSCTVSDGRARGSQYRHRRPVVPWRPHWTALALILSLCFGCGDVFAVTRLDVQSVSGLGCVRSACHWSVGGSDVLMGLPKPSEAPYIGESHDPPAPTALKRCGPPSFPNQWLSSSSAPAPHFFAAACSAFDIVSFSGWTMVLFTAARAAPRLGYSASTPSRCRT